MGTKIISKRAFPRKATVGGAEYTIRLMTPEDRDLLGLFTSGLAEDDLLFLRMDITKREVLERWCDNVHRGMTTTVLAIDEHGKIAGYCSLHRNELLCTSHHGELRVFVLGRLRGGGLGEFLVNEIFRVAREQKLERIIMNIAREQRGLRQMLEGLGFRVEALLTDWLKSRDGRTHDLVIMSYSMED